MCTFHCDFWFRGLNFKSVYWCVVCLLISQACAGAKIHSNVCYGHKFNVQKSVIIKTEDSVTNGAAEIKTLHTATLDACLRNCCKLPKCTVAVYETSTKNLCYLFNCGRDASLCEFEQHSRYTMSIKLDRVNGQGMSRLKSRVTAKHRPLPAPAMQPGPESSKSAQCRFPPDVQFRCLDAAKFPSCVAVYDRCDGVPQCGDSSDELDCSAQDKSNEEGSNSGQPPVHSFSAHRTSSSSSRSSITSVIKKTPTTTVTASTVDGQPSEVVASELAENYRQARAAVIGLGASLAVTLVAIVALGCRLRQLRTRVGGISGKLRSRAVDDEDYLINGMYL